MNSFCLLLGLAVLAAAEQATFSAPQRTTFHHPIKRVAVIGAGPAGLQAAAKLIEHNFTVRLFDRSPGPGGNWFYTDETPARESYPDPSPDDTAEIPDNLPFTHYYEEGEDGISLDQRWKEHWRPRPVWNNLHTNSPQVITELPDVKYLPDTPWVLSHHQIQRHVRAYASFHNLNANDYPASSTAPPVTAYSTRVDKLQKLKDQHIWRLYLRRLEHLPETNRLKATWFTEEFDAVIIATGPYGSAHVPDIKGILDWSEATEAGRHSVYHAQSYRRPERYENKVFILAFLSPHEYRNPFQRRSLDRFPNTTEAVPEIDHFEPLDTHDNGIQHGKIHLKNGTVLHGIDEIILATGYIRSNFFFNNYTSDGQPANLHWTGVYIPDPTLAYTNVRPWTIGKYQSYALAKVWEGTAHLPTQKEQWEDYHSGKYNFRGLFGTAQSEGLARQYVAWLNNESLVNGGRFVEPWPLENREVFVYYSNVEWGKGYASLANFTEVEETPASEWKKRIWDAIVYDDESW
ncbi:FAD/NAD-P-binding domain-containing protein [Mycena rebaudengoi]|nr:FAD/NAD-P-binding domain-containing protein [Mycena rebaudengoi]